jgi:hypothetical protein
MAGAALALVAPVAPALSGCETTAEESAKLEVKAKREKALHPTLAQKGLSITHPSTQVQVLDATAVHSSEGAAAVVTVHNTSAQALRSVPIAITVKSATGQTLYQNNAPGLETALTQISSLPAHGSLTWVDDQVPSAGIPASVTATVGQAPSASGSQPRIEVEGPHPGEEASDEATGNVRNGSNVTQQKLVVYVIARHAGRIVAAGRAILPEAAAGAPVPFHAFLVGSMAGARLEARAPATTFG